MSLKNEILAHKQKKDQEHSGVEGGQKHARCRANIPSMQQVKNRLLAASEQRPYPNRIGMAIGLSWGCVYQHPSTNDFIGIKCLIHLEFTKRLEAEDLEWVVHESSGSHGVVNLTFYIKMPRPEGDRP